MPFSSAVFVIAAIASGLSMPVKGPDSTTVPGTVDATSIVSPDSGASPVGWITTLTGRSYLRANSKSRWSWAGTAMIAPVPYSARTKLAIQIGTGSPVKGLTALRPVSKPSFSICPVSRAVRSSARNRPT